ncbi:putative membrane protein, partial [Yersinia pestis PY-54]
MKILKRLIFICLVIIIIFFLIDCSMQKVAEGR